MTGAGGQAGLALRDHLPGAAFATHAELDVTDSRRGARGGSGAPISSSTPRR